MRRAGNFPTLRCINLPCNPIIFYVTNVISSTVASCTHSLRCGFCYNGARVLTSENNDENEMVVIETRNEQPSVGPAMLPLLFLKRASGFFNTDPHAIGTKERSLIEMEILKKLTFRCFNLDIAACS